MFLFNVSRALLALSLNGRIIVRSQGVLGSVLGVVETMHSDFCLFSEKAPLVRVQNVFRKSCEEVQGLSCFLEVDV